MATIKDLYSLYLEAENWKMDHPIERDSFSFHLGYILAICTLECQVSQREIDWCYNTLKEYEKAKE
jgi:hypothetical protein